MSGPRGRFVVLDGVDGCGKTTQARRLVEALVRERGDDAAAVLHVREPGTTALGEGLRALLLGGREELDAATEALLFAAARRHLLAREIAPALAAGRDVVCERFHASTCAYQGVAGGLGAGVVLELLQRFADDPAPDVEIVLDVDPKIAFARRDGHGDRIEDKGLGFQTAVAAGYRAYVAERARARLVDGDADETTVHERVRACVPAAATAGPAE